MTQNPKTIFSRGESSNGTRESQNRKICYLLDSSALLAFLKREPGCEKVAEAIRQGAAIATPNYAEALTKLAEEMIKKGDPNPDLSVWESVIAEMDLEVMPCDAVDAAMAASLRAPTWHLGRSLGDRFCLAVAKRYSLVALTSEKAWKEIKEDGINVELFR